MEIRKCRNCHNQKELNEDNFILKGTIYTKMCIPCLVKAKKTNNKRDEKKVCCLVCKDGVEINIRSFKRHCKTIKHQNNLNGIKKEPIICIYKIYCKNSNIKSIYIGKTRNFNRRKTRHKLNCNNENTNILYNCINDNDGFDNWIMEIVEECPEEDLEKLELYYYEKFKPDLNSVKPNCNFENAVIYEIKCKDKNIIDGYIGSTTNFNQRKGEHKKNCNNENNKEYNKKLYQFIRGNGDWGNWNMEIIKVLIDCKSEKELKKYEQEYINNCKYPLLNNIKAYKTKEEEKETQKEKHKEFYEKEKENKVYCKYCNSGMIKRNFKIHWNLKIHKQNVKNFEENLCILIKKMNI